MLDIIIIGAGPIGIYASSLAQLHSLNGIVIESLDYIGGQLTSLYPEKDIIDVPGFEKISAKEYIKKLSSQQKNMKNAFKIHLNEKVVSIEKEDDHYIVNTTSSTYKTKTILLSTGMGTFEPRKIGLENENSFNNIIYSLKDKNIYKDKKLAILGGGDSAVDWAINLKPIAKEVYVIHRRDDFRAKSNSVEKMNQLGVKILKPYIIKSLNGVNSVSTITLEHKDNKTSIDIDVDAIFVNYGLIPTVSNFGIEQINNAYLVNSYQMTSLENIFAIGNAATYDGKVKNITAGLGEAVIAITKIDQIIHPNKNIPVHF